MKKTALTIILAFSALLAFSQQSKSSNHTELPKQEVKALDSTITIKVTKQQLKQIEDILQSAGQSISKSNLPINDALQTIQGLNAIVSFFKQYEQPKKEK